MGNPMIGGQHWMAVSNKHKAYSDPLNLPRPRVIPKDYKSYNETISLIIFDQSFQYRHGSLNLDYRIIDEYDTNDGFFVKVFGQGETFWCRFISYDPNRNALVLRVDQLLCREHPFKYGQLIMVDVGCCEL
ncbi:hypothetical protein PHYSODRAFT_530930 [Phytophthora sojae]|uniref:Uncharacterized protein n=1 Tax=Phytophthora sojae (strain P6497) TaxID=1094619 RepID=G5ACX2_PHYSP|nr:hypothetical protein PHYSODRAFT_530930 [Phytophthora sojae]EGZ06634.1 hypothetical protein PHYSODRAFT_530930 [Phytophthora sojae]|eukprot:XP_009537398.1 hypothetical protein PHYSODRAFT_530930 [Phytophthora sojae]